MNTSSNNLKKEDSILLNSILFLANKNNIHIDKSKIFEELKKKNLMLHLDTLKNTLHIYSKSDINFSVRVHNTTVNDLKSARAIALLRYSVNSIVK
ncbi:hypothetical protein NMF54_18905 [Clostridioides difficile]|uniref:hypothetical protein n=1 Tax=Clostridioides difficile TaxID=1496 RepID=UPI0020C25F51|nr:hypothetical protein [Clostridioides difficile]MCP8421216.1 hypothetical protein [Clostridioides difficile]